MFDQRGVAKDKEEGAVVSKEMNDIQGIIAQTRNLLEDYFYENSLEIHKHLSFTFHSYTRILDTFPIEKLNSNFVKAIESIPQEVERNSLIHWYSRIEETVRNIFTEKSNTILTREVRRGLGKAFCHEMSSFFPQKEFALVLQDEIFLKAFDLYALIHCLTWQIENKTLTNDTIRAFMFPIIQYSAAKAQTIEDDQKMLKGVFWTKCVTRYFDASGAKLTGVDSHYSFNKIFRKTALIQIKSHESPKETSPRTNIDPILADIYRLLLKFQSINYAPQDYIKKENGQKLLPTALWEGIQSFKIHYREKNLSQWVKEIAPRILNYLFEPTLNASEALEKAGITDNVIKKYIKIIKSKTFKNSIDVAITEKDRENIFSIINKNTSTEFKTLSDVAEIFTDLNSKTITHLEKAAITEGDIENLVEKKNVTTYRALVAMGISEETLANSLEKANESIEIEDICHLIFSIYFIKYMQQCFIETLKSEEDIDLAEWLTELAEVFSHVGSYYLNFRCGELLEYAIEDLDQKMVTLNKNKMLLEEKEDISDWSIILLAAKCGHLSIIKQCFQVHRELSQYRETLCITAEYGQIDLVSYLIQKGVDSGGKFIRGKKEYTLLELAARYGQWDVVKYLIENTKTDDVEQAFLLSVEHEHSETACGLYDYLGFFKGNVINRAYFIAAQKGSATMLDSLQKKSGYPFSKEVLETATRSENSITAFEYLVLYMESSGILNACILNIAAESLQSNRIEYLLKRYLWPQSAKDDALIIANKHRRRQNASLLVQHGANHNTTRLDGDTLELIYSDMMRNISNPNYIDYNGYTSLHFAVNARSIPHLRALLLSGAKIDKKTKDGISPLLYAVDRMNDLDVVQYLIDNDAEVDARVRLQCTALMWAVILCKREMVRCLLMNNAYYGANLKDKNNYSVMDFLFAEENKEKLAGRMTMLPDFFFFSSDLKSYQLSLEQNITLLKYFPTSGEIHTLSIKNMKEECQSNFFWKALLKAIKNSPCLTTLEILDNNLSSAQVLELISILPSLKHLSVLKLTRNVFDNSHTDALNELSKLECLTIVDFSDNIIFGNKHELRQALKTVIDLPLKQHSKQEIVQSIVCEPLTEFAKYIEPFKTRLDEINTLYLRKKDKHYYAAYPAKTKEILSLLEELNALMADLEMDLTIKRIDQIKLSSSCLSETNALEDAVNTVKNSFKQLMHDMSRFKSTHSKLTRYDFLLSVEKKLSEFCTILKTNQEKEICPIASSSAVCFQYEKSKEKEKEKEEEIEVANLKDDETEKCAKYFYRT